MSPHHSLGKLRRAAIYSSISKPRGRRARHAARTQDVVPVKPARAGLMPLRIAHNDCSMDESFAGASIMQLKRCTEVKPADLPYIESAFFAVSVVLPAPAGACNQIMRCCWRAASNDLNRRVRKYTWVSCGGEILASVEEIAIVPADSGPQRSGLRLCLQQAPVDAYCTGVLIAPSCGSASAMLNIRLNGTLGAATTQRCAEPLEGTRHRRKG